MNSIGTKLVLQITIVITLVMIGFGAFNVSQQKAIFTQRLNSKEERSLHQLSVILGSLLFTMDRNQIENVMTSTLSDPDVLSIKIFEDETVIHYFEKKPKTQELIDLSQPGLKPTSFTNAVKRNASLTYDEEQLGSLEVIFSRHFISERVRRTITEIALSLLCVVVIEILVVLQLVKRNVTRPLLDIVQAALKIAEGNVDVQLKKFSFRDEIGTLATAFERMVTYIRSMADVATSISTGDLRHNVKPRSPKDVLGHSFQRMTLYLNGMATVTAAIAEGDLAVRIPLGSEIDAFGKAMLSMTRGLQSLIQQIRTIAEQIDGTGTTLARLAQTDINIVKQVLNSVGEMGRTMADMGTSVEEVAENMDTLSSSVEETSNSVSEMTASITNIASNSTDLASQTQDTISALEKALQMLKQVTEKTTLSRQLSEETIREAVEGQEAVEQVRASMEMIQQTNLNAVETINRFEQRSQDIGTILDVIQQISEQSSLLSLNASIIAAQAGSHGKGFAVIADEMRDLATKVGSSVKDIASIVDTVQQDTKEVVQMIHESTTKIEQGADRTQYARKMLLEIISSAERSSTMVADIADALQQEMLTSTEVMDDMERVHAMMRETTRATNEQKTSTLQIDNAISQISDKAEQTRQTSIQQLEGVQQVVRAVNTVKPLADQNLQSSAQIERTAADLAEQSQNLLQSVDRFKLPKGEKKDSKPS